ncbi:MAG: hypothetical protein M3457_08380 [Chloroflexota bacterium]|nr:hypothetical protein [Chloroflexota bacterium]
MHDLLRRQFGIVAGGAFIPHITIKGFFHSDATIGAIAGAVDVALKDRPPFTVVNNGPVPLFVAVSLSMSSMGSGTRRCTKPSSPASRP